MRVMSNNPILDYYTMAYVAGFLGYPIFNVFQMPSRHSKSVTAFRFKKVPKVLVLAGDTTVQSFRTAINKQHQKGNDKLDLNLIIVEDASKIRYKVRDDFFALIAQFSSGMVTVDQAGMSFDVKTHTSVILNTPPFFYKDLEKYLLNAGSGDRFDLMSTRLSDIAKERLDEYGMYNMPLDINPVELPVINKEYYPDFVHKMRTSKQTYSSNELRCKFACHCAGIDVNLIEKMHNKEIKKIEWEDFWLDQIDPYMQSKTVQKYANKRKP